MRRFKLSVSAFLIALVIFSLSGCSGFSDGFLKRSIFAMNTVIDINSDGITEADLDDAAALIHSLELIFDFKNPDSELYRWNESTGGGKVSPEFYSVVKTGAEIYDLSGGVSFGGVSSFGACDITIGALVELWDIPNRSEFVPDESEIKAALALSGFEYLKIYESGGEFFVEKTLPGLRLSLGGIAKGWALEQTVEFLKSRGGKHIMVSFGGNVGVAGGKSDGSPWKIGIRSPRPESGNETVGCFEITDGYIAVSGDYERYFERDGVRYCHIFDPQTGYPVTGTQSAVVLTESGAVGDALSTALFVMNSRGETPDMILSREPGIFRTAYIIDESGQRLFGDEKHFTKY